MSGYEEDLSDDGQDPDQYMKNEGKSLSQARKEVKPKALKTIHTMEKVLASLLV
jgi:FKBP-type peptidyl-prolyl cis-trans isomerase (trigger factor)